MIGLDREMPHSCLECPSMHTIRLEVPEKQYTIPGQEYLFRGCAATHMRNIVEPILYTKGTKVPKEWMEFPIPQWCPWVPIGDKK